MSPVLSRDFEPPARTVRLVLTSPPLPEIHKYFAKLLRKAPSLRRARPEEPRLVLSYFRDVPARALPRVVAGLAESEWSDFDVEFRGLGIARNPLEGNLALILPGFPRGKGLAAFQRKAGEIVAGIAGSPAGRAQVASNVSLAVWEKGDPAPDISEIAREGASSDSALVRVDGFSLMELNAAGEPERVVCRARVSFVDSFAPKLVRYPEAEAEEKRAPRHRPRSARRQKVLA